MDFKTYDIIEYAGDYFMVLKNYGHCGRVQEYFPGGNVGEIVEPFYWVYEGLECRKVNHAHMNEISLLREEIRRLEKRIDLQNRYIERMGFCPDCRDKVDETCYRCKCQGLEKRLRDIIDIIKFAEDFQCEDVAPDKCSGIKQIIEMIE